MVRKHSGMSLLQSDFSRHSLVNPLGPEELRVFIKSHARKISPSYVLPPGVLYRAQTVLGPDSVGFPRDWLGKAKSSDVASSIPDCSSKFSKLSLTHTKWESINRKYS
jgi:hypothetical protein